MLTIRDLVKVYPGNPPVTALHGISLDIPPGMFGLLGPNGAGKTTLMRVVAGVLEATGGSIAFHGEDILKRPDHLWPQLGFLPQEFGFYPHLTGMQMLDFLLTMKGVTAAGLSRKALVLELLERVNLGYAAKRRVREYSGGMKQRLGIAQALAGDPKLIIVDEPTAGLDPEERHRFYRLLSELAEDRTVLLSTHIVEDVAVLCRRMAMIAGGRVVAQTTPADARTVLAGSIFEGEVTTAELKELRENYCVTQAVLHEGVNLIRVYVPYRTAPDMRFSPVTPTLEDAYLAVMRGGATLTPPPAPPIPPPSPVPLPYLALDLPELNGHDAAVETAVSVPAEEV